MHINLSTFSVSPAAEAGTVITQLVARDESTGNVIPCTFELAQPNPNFKLFMDILVTWWDASVIANMPAPGNYNVYVGVMMTGNPPATGKYNTIITIVINVLPITIGQPSQISATQPDGTVVLGV